MNKFLLKSIFFILTAHIVAWLIGTLIFWGLGNLAIWVLKIDYVWTFWHGVLVEFAYVIITQIFGGKKSDN